MACGHDYIIHFQMCFSPVYQISMHGLDINFTYFYVSSVIIDVHNSYLSPFVTLKCWIVVRRYNFISAFSIIFHIEMVTVAEVYLHERPGYGNELVQGCNNSSALTLYVLNFSEGT